MRIRIYLNSNERKVIRKCVKPFPRLKAAWNRCQAYLWSGVRMQKACKFKTELPDMDFFIGTDRLYYRVLRLWWDVIAWIEYTKYRWDRLMGREYPDWYDDLMKPLQ